MSWKILKKEVTFKNKWVQIDGWKVKQPNGKTDDFYFKNSPDFVFVLAVTPNNQVVILKQYYINVGKKLWSLVAGYVDKKETLLQTAKRELLEETGFKASKYINLGWRIRGRWALGRGHYFLAQGAVKVSATNHEPAEDIEVKVVSMKKFKQLLASGAFKDVFAELGARLAVERLSNK